tara:strand:+ start:889 stop:2340 length:1452 start_codon:yes stop_codon:yes gene_type:complete
MVFIYVLKLKEDKWYIGKTESSKFRIDTHFDNKGSAFTKKYSPEEIYQIIPECDKYDEDKYVKKYMDKYGMDNVRGGSYSRLELTEDEKKLIQKELWGANDLCFLCGEDHFVIDCPKYSVEDTDQIEPEVVVNETDKEVVRAKIIKNYENELFKLMTGYWVLQLDCTEKYKHMHIPRIIFEDYNYDFNNYFSKYNITDLKFKLDGREVGSYPCIYTGMTSTSNIEIYLFIKAREMYKFKYLFIRGKYYLNAHNSCYIYEYEKEKTLLEQKLFMLKNIVLDNKVYISDEYNLKRSSYQKRIESSLEMIFSNIDSKKQLCGTRQTQSNISFNFTGKANHNIDGSYNVNNVLNNYEQLYTLFKHISATIDKNFDKYGCIKKDIIRFGEENTLSGLHSVVCTEMYIYYIFTNLGNESYTIKFEENNIIKDFFKYNLHLIINSIQNYGYQVRYSQYIPRREYTTRGDVYIPVYANYYQTSSFAIILDD